MRKLTITHEAVSMNMDKQKKIVWHGDAGSRYTTLEEGSLFVSKSYNKSKDNGCWHWNITLKNGCAYKHGTETTMKNAKISAELAYLLYIKYLK